MTASRLKGDHSEWRQGGSRLATEAWVGLEYTSGAYPARAASRISSASCPQDVTSKQRLVAF